MDVRAMWIAGWFTTAVWTDESDQVYALFGQSVSTAGDVDGDGYADVIVGAPRFDNGSIDEGQASVYLGSAGGLAAAPAWTAEGNQELDNFALYVTGGGDVNGDAFDDVAVASPGGFLGDGQGWVSVFHGSAGGLETTAGWVGAETEWEYHIAYAGDVNGDGFDDLLHGSTGSFDQSFEGRASVYLGTASGLPASADWTAQSDSPYSGFGAAVASAGDVNADGFDDVVIGAPGFSVVDSYGSNHGRAVAFLGSPSGLETEPAWSATGGDDASLGASVSSAGDVNDDGFDDLIIGSPGWDTDVPFNDMGEASLFLGSAGGLEPEPAWTVQGDQGYAALGTSVSAAGDLNDDGYDDVAVVCPGCINTIEYSAVVDVFLGFPAGLESTAEFVVNAEWNAWFGAVVAPAGDVDADGADDLIIGSPAYDNGEPYEGRASLYAGVCTDPVDTDGDGMGDMCDVCPAVYDPAQEDDDDDGIGDACDPCPANSPDADADGFCAPQECDDTNPTVYPGAEEICDGVDNACAGIVRAEELDEDGDGELVCAGDCDDADSNRFSGQTETCNGIDDDCDGEVDPGCGSDEETEIGSGTECACNGTGSAAGAPLLALVVWVARVARRRVMGVGGAA